MKFSDEQLKYITFSSKQDTKLIACAGSGKTACIIARMNYLIKKEIFDNNELIMLTFSRFTKNDFINKILSQDEEILIDSENIMTIDSFAKNIIDPYNKIDVSLLSITLQNKLRDHTFMHPKLDEIKCIFIDEAQDLNEIQFNILHLLKDRFKIILNFIGDPNQNIFQFRGSSDHHMVKFDAKTFYLTYNFRSAKHIVDFCKWLRPYGESNIKTTKKMHHEIKPEFFCHNDEDIFEKDLIQIINDLKNQSDLSKIAILAPTRGQIKYRRSKGLSLVANILSLNKIPFKQFYDESSEESDNIINYKPEINKINLLTYMGSKGLQWDFVILIDANFGLINKKHFDIDKHHHDRYLLYVACSRAIKQMFIFTNYRYLGKKKTIGLVNPWFKQIPKSYYSIDSLSEYNFKFAEIQFNKVPDFERNINRLISRIKEDDLLKLSEIIDYENIKKNTFKFGRDFTSLENTDYIFLSKLSEIIFIYQAGFRKKIKDLENVINGKNIIRTNDTEIQNWIKQNQSLKWDEIPDDTPDKIKKFLEKLDKSLELRDYTLIVSKFYKLFVEHKIDFIKEKYQKYLENKSWNDNLENIFYMVLFKHSIDTYHYYHIYNDGEKYRYLLDQYKDMFVDSANALNELKIKDTNVPINDFGMIGEIDILTKNDEIYNIKCVKSIGLKQILQLLICNLIFYLNEKNNYIINFINLLKSEIYKYELNIKNPKEIISILQKYITI